MSSAPVTRAVKDLGDLERLREDLNSYASDMDRGDSRLWLALDLTRRELQLPEVPDDAGSGSPASYDPAKLLNMSMPPVSGADLRRTINQVLFASIGVIFQNLGDIRRRLVRLEEAAGLPVGLRPPEPPPEEAATAGGAG